MDRQYQQYQQCQQYRQAMRTCVDRRNRLFWGTLLLALLLLLLPTLPFATEIRRDSPDLRHFLKEGGGLVKPGFGFSPESGLREGEMQIHGASIIVELALDSPSQAKGLMGREVMPENRGMLFLFPQTQPLSFWMKNTLIPLDIIYISEAGDVIDIVQAEPCRTRQCPSYPAKAPGKYVLELNSGMAEKLGLKVGDNLNWHWR